MKQFLNQLLLLLVLCGFVTNDAAAQSAGKTAETARSFHPMAERFDAWRAKVGSTPELEAYIDRLSRNYFVEPATRPSGRRSIKKSGDQTSVFEDMVRLDDQSFDEGTSMQSVITDQNGDLLMVYKFWGEAGPDFFGPSTVPPEIFFVRSSDGGQTWTAPVAVRGDGERFLDFNFPTLRQTADGRLIVFANEEAMSYSEDGGLTWQAGDRDNFFSDRFHGPIDGKIWHTYVDFALEAFVYRTSEDGLTWTDQKTLLPFVPTTSELFLSSVAEVDDGTLVAHFFRFTFEPCCSNSMETIQSTDGGLTWSDFRPVPFAAEGLEPFDGQMKVSPDGTLWIVSVSASPEFFVPGDIYFQSSADGGASWSEPARFTRYAGGDFLPDVAFTPDEVFIAFSSDRYVASGNGNIWYGYAGTTPDVNPPPYIDQRFGVPNWTGPDRPLPVGFLAADESAVASVDLDLEYGSESVSVELKDDGAGADETAGDGIYSGEIPGLPFGEVATYNVTVMDDSGQEDSIGPFELDRVPITQSGDVVIAVDRDGWIGQGLLFANPQFAAVQWPGPSGFNFVYGGGLFVGYNGRPARVMHKFYDNGFEGSSDWIPAEGSYPVASDAVSDSDFTFSFTDRGAPDPIGLRVKTSLYQWSEGDATNAVVFRYEITNQSGGELAELYASMWMDPDVYLEIFGALDDKIAYDADNGILYMFDSGQECSNPDFNPDGLPCSDAHVGLTILEDPSLGKSAAILPHTAAKWLGSQDPFRTGNGDSQFIRLMTGGIDASLGLGLDQSPNDYRMLVTAQPMNLADGETGAVAFAIVMGNSLEELVTNAAAVAAEYAAAPVAVEDVAAGEQPVGFELGQNYPNPFNPTTTIPFFIEESSQVTIVVSDVLGRPVRRLVDRQLASGSYRVSFSGDDLPSGSYFYSLEAGGGIQTKTLFLLK